MKPAGGALTRTPAADPVIVLGEFDGFHLGHRHLLSAAAALAARRGRPLVGVVLDALVHREVLTPPQRRSRLLLANGASTVRVLEVPADTTSGAGIVALVREMSRGPVVMSCPPTELGSFLFPRLDVAMRLAGAPVVEVARAAGPDSRPITSAGVRASVRAGDVGWARRLSGAPVTLTGTVSLGNQLGRTIGFPTANLVDLVGLVLPANGVYAAEVVLDDGSRHDAAVNVGVRPTVGDVLRPIVEAHLLDVADGLDLYGREIDVCLLDRLRDERRFDGLDALSAQLRCDVEAVRALRRSA